MPERGMVRQSERCFVILRGCATGQGTPGGTPGMEGGAFGAIPGNRSKPCSTFRSKPTGPLTA